MEKKNLPQPLFVKEGSQNNKIRVVVAMSGGVDSSVAAAMLKKQGYDVVGVFMRFWHETRTGADGTRNYADGFNSPPARHATLVVAGGQPSLKIREGEKNPPQPSFRKEGENTNTCCSEGAEQAARNVAVKLGIPFYILNAQKEFKKAVVDYFLAEERRGHTPNPCVACNKKIKFGLLFEKMRGMGGDFLATGHYARIAVIATPQRRGKQSRGRQMLSDMIAASLDAARLAPRNDTRYKLFKAKDEKKDQSYFLYTLAQKHLGRILFPLGEFAKAEVYKMAKKWKLPYRKDESFDLCFVANDVGGFLRRHLEMKEGRIVQFCHSGESRNPDSKPGSRVKPGMTPNLILGTHQGLAHYTIGQRKSVPVQNGPWWVVKKDRQKNILYVSNNEKDLYSQEILATGVNWLNGKASKLPLKVWAKIRYKSEAAEAKVFKFNAPQPPLKIRGGAGELCLRVVFKKPQRAITPGQSVVFYSKNGEVLGGGVIEK